MFLYHKKLHPKIWSEDLHINALVSQTLQMIAQEYIRYLGNVIGLPISVKDIQDIIIHGSITNYYWDKYSDIDLCIIADLSRLREQQHNINEMLFFRALTNHWLRTFKISIFGCMVDIKVIDCNQNNTGYIVGSHYSLMQNIWLYQPVRISRHELRSIKKIAFKRYRAIMRQCKYILKHKMPSEYIDTYLMQLQQLRVNSMMNQYYQPITSMTMAFKMMRNAGIFEKLQKRSQQDRSKKYQLI